MLTKIPSYLLADFPIADRIWLEWHETSPKGKPKAPSRVPSALNPLRSLPASKIANQSTSNCSKPAQRVYLGGLTDLVALGAFKATQMTNKPREL
jgi:hypothetical protein